jgi:hypothetical protein
VTDSGFSIMDPRAARAGWRWRMAPARQLP